MAGEVKTDREVQLELALLLSRWVCPLTGELNIDDPVRGSNAEELAERMLMAVEKAGLTIWDHMRPYDLLVLKNSFLQGLRGDDEG